MPILCILGLILVGALLLCALAAGDLNEWK